MLINFRNISQRQEIDLPLSKSESNRALMIWYYSEFQDFRNSGIQDFRTSASQYLSNLVSLSNSDDTILLQQLLNKLQNIQSPSSEIIELNCNNAGTVIRFLLTAVANQCIINNKEDSQELRNSGTQELSILLTGSDRMKSRPISSLVDALRSLGVSIKYVEKEGFPPVLVEMAKDNETMVPEPVEGTIPHFDKLSDRYEPTASSQLTLHSLEISVEQSSQFASSLLLAAPLWENGLELHLTGNLSSLPYIDMTINMMKQCGIDVERKGRVVTVKPGTYNIENIKVEPDWSAAAFWYEMIAFSEDSEILLKNLNINSLQADAAAIKMFQLLGVETIAAENGVVLRKTQRCKDTETQNQWCQSLSKVQCIISTNSVTQKSTDNDTTVPDPVEGTTRYFDKLCDRYEPTASSQLTAHSSQSTFNFKDCPDLFPAVIATCAGLQIDATFTGLKNLSIKESDRKQAMINELKKINIFFETVSDDVLIMKCPESLPYFTEENPIIFNNYNDHRIAMALSILSMKIGTIEMSNPECVSKSYPGFFRCVRDCGGIL